MYWAIREKLSAVVLCFFLGENVNFYLILQILILTNAPKTDFTVRILVIIFLGY